MRSRTKPPTNPWWGIEYECDVPFINEVVDVNILIDVDLVCADEQEWYCMREQCWAIREFLTDRNV